MDRYQDGVRLVLISDTHSLHDAVDVPDGDVLVHAGDSTRRGRPEEIRAFDAWLGTLPHPYKVVISGNHDFAFERDPQARTWIRNATYLQDEGIGIEGLRFWGSPWQPRFFDWAFNLDRGAPLAEKWALVPDDVDVLITHGPPMGILDRIYRGEHVGCEALLEAVIARRPRLHVFGHIHEAYGAFERDGTTFVNASTCTLTMQPTNPPVVIDL